MCGNQSYGSLRHWFVIIHWQRRYRSIRVCKWSPLWAFCWITLSWKSAVHYVNIWTFVFIMNVHDVIYATRTQSCIVKPEIHHHHKHQGLDPLIRPVSTVTAACANASSVFRLFSFLAVYSGMISKGFGFVVFFASVKASFVCIHLSCLVCV